MISKRKRNTVLAYCIATVIMLCVLASNMFEVTTSLKTNTRKVVADNNYVETSEISYGLVAIEASSCIEDKDTQNVTEENDEKDLKEEESKKESESKTDEDKNESSKSNETKAAKSNSSKTKSNKTTTSKKTTKKSTTKKSTTKKSTTKKSNTSSKKKSVETKATEEVVTTSSNSSLGSEIASFAKQFNGNPYVHGGTSLTKGADCSGFVQSVYKHFGIKLPRTASQQAKVGKKVSWNSLQPGDLIFYGNHSSTKVAHVAIYIGNGKIIHAQTPKLGIGITTYNIMTKVTARRVI